jgi:hypothetical protein
VYNRDIGHAKAEVLEVTGGEFMKIIETTLFILISTFTVFSVQSAGSGESNETIEAQLQWEKVQSVLANSAETRQMASGRTLAGMNAEEKFWADEFKQIMDDEEGKDYLSLSLEL